MTANAQLVAALEQYAKDDFWEYGCGCCCVPKDDDGEQDWDRLGEVTAGDLARRTLTAVQQRGLEMGEKKNPEFGVHMLNDEGKKKAAAIADAFDTCLNKLTEVCMAGRELSLCKTKLEEACFFAKKAMAINLGNQQPPAQG